MVCDPVILMLGGGALAALMIAAGLHKLADPASFRQTLYAYRLLPGSLVTPVGLALPVMEIAAGGAVLPPGLSHSPGLLLAAVLLAVYAGAIAINLRRGNRHIDCGCLGFGARRPELRWSLVGRNLVLAALAVTLAALRPDDRPLLALDWIAVTAGLGVLALFYLSFDLLLTLPRAATPPKTEIAR